MRFVIAPEYDFTSWRDTWRYFDSLGEAVYEFMAIVERGRRDHTPKQLTALGRGGPDSFPDVALGPTPQQPGDFEAISAWMKLNLHTGCLIHYENQDEATGVMSEYWLVQCEASGRFWIPSVTLIGNESDAPWVTALEAGIEIARLFSLSYHKHGEPEGQDDQWLIDLLHRHASDYPSVPIWSGIDQKHISRASLDELKKRCNFHQ